MATIRLTEFQISAERTNQLRALVPESGWSILSSTELTGVLPDRFLGKVDSVIGVSSPT